MSEKRNIFEEVGEGAPRPKGPRGGMIARGARGSRRAVRLWLMVLFALVVVMIVVGGLTRLTDSGLSITEWAPVTGTVPPLDAAAWEAEFDKYRQIPEYHLQNKGMTLAEFKAIYWWEWGHRQLGRVIGLVWAVGFVGFLALGRIPPGWAGRLLFVGALGGAQGAVGWWMVSSGLEGTMLDVASYRLAAHLGLAFVILGVIAVYVLQLGREARDLMQARRARDGRLVRWATVLAGIAFVQILLGALVAGIDAGRGYTDWPLMAGGFLPPDPFDLRPVWRNFLEDDGLVQFMHRMVGYLLLLAGGTVWYVSRSSPHFSVRFAFNAVMAMLVLQMVLGIVTVIYSAPWQIAILHQIGAVVLWVLVLRARFLAAHPVFRSLKGT